MHLEALVAECFGYPITMSPLVLARPTSRYMQSSAGPSRKASKSISLPTIELPFEKGACAAARGEQCK